MRVIFYKKICSLSKEVTQWVHVHKISSLLISDLVIRLHCLMRPCSGICDHLHASSSSNVSLCSLLPPFNYSVVFLLIWALLPQQSSSVLLSCSWVLFPLSFFTFFLCLLFYLRSGVIIPIFQVLFLLSSFSLPFTFPHVITFYSDSVPASAYHDTQMPLACR